MFVEPAYGTASLADVFPAVATALGVDAGLAETALELPDAASYVVLLVDGMGLDLILKHPEHAPYLSELVGHSRNRSRGAGGTAGVPSTTATSLTSLGTGLAPGGHGTLGYTSRDPDTGTLLNALKWSESVDPLVWQPEETAFSKLSRAGVLTSVVSRRDYRESGLTRSGQRGAHYVGADDPAERLAASVAAAAYSPSVTYVYDSDLDRTGHRFGVDSSEWRSVLLAVDEFCEHLRESLPPSVRLLITADHGMVDSPNDARIDVDRTPGLNDGLAMLAGEARFRHLYVEPGAGDDVMATWSEVLGDRATVIRREDAVAAGWFGEVSERVLPRLGDVLVATRDNYAVLSSQRFPQEMSLVGMHGSMTAAEMRIPLLVD